MKIIDLLNKIANGEDVPKYVQYYNMLKDKTDSMMVCKENIFYKLDQLEIQLNSRIEPVEEEKKIPEKFKINYEIDEENTINMEKATMLECDLACRINEIIDYLKEKEKMKRYSEIKK